MESAETAAADTPRAAADRPRAAALARFALGATLALGLLAGLHFYIGVRLIDRAGLEGPAALAAWAALWALMLSMPLGMLAGLARGNPLAAALRWTGYLWMGSFGLILALLAGTDLTRVALELLGVPSPAGTWMQAQAVGVAGLAAPALAYGLWRARRPVIERLSVRIAGLAPQLEGLRIVQLSDLHLGDTLDRRYAEGLVRQVEALQPDLVAITGDLADGSPRAAGAEVAPLAGLRAPLGVYVVAGNHETYGGASAWELFLRQLGLQVLHNEHRVVSRGEGRLVIAGVTDFDGGRIDPAHASSPEEALSGAPAGVPRILLAHQPRSAFQAAGLGIDLQLSGHTHGGQMFPWMFFVRLQQPVVRGLRRIAGVPVYTHRGTGFWGPPIRIGASPEIAVLTLTRG